ncbi:hypothetical protein, partial [Nostoc linckia]
MAVKYFIDLEDEKPKKPKKQGKFTEAERELMLSAPAPYFTATAERYGLYLSMLEQIVTDRPRMTDEQIAEEVNRRHGSAYDGKSLKTLVQYRADAMRELQVFVDARREAEEQAKQQAAETSPAHPVMSRFILECVEYAAAKTGNADLMDFVAEQLDAHPIENYRNRIIELENSGRNVLDTAARFANMAESACLEGLERDAKARGALMQTATHW